MCRQSWNPSPLRTRVCLSNTAFPRGAPATLLEKKQDLKGLRVSRREGLGAECPMPGDNSC